MKSVCVCMYACTYIYPSMYVCPFELMWAMWARVWKLPNVRSKSYCIIKLFTQLYTFLWGSFFLVGWKMGRVNLCRLSELLYLRHLWAKKLSSRLPGVAYLSKLKGSVSCIYLYRHVVQPEAMHRKAWYKNYMKLFWLEQFVREWQCIATWL